LEAGANVTSLERILSWSAYPEKAAQICNEKGVGVLVSRALHKLAWPMIEWGGITFFERDLTSFVVGVDPPRGILLHEATLADIESVTTGIDPTRRIEAIVDRFRRGDRAFVAMDSSGKAAHVRWVTSRAYVPEVGRDIVLSTHEAYFYDGYTRPELRRRGIDAAVRCFIFRQLQAEGYTKAYSYVRHDNHAGLRATARWQRPVGSLGYIRVGPLGPRVVSTRGSSLPRLIKTTDANCG
jgi:ribosomal protein S18 acetylase RimI-like enzyme